VVIETTCIFPALSTHDQSQQNSTMAENYKRISWLISTSAVNENLNIAWRSIIAVSITG
jgi:hypothetical protein